MTVLCFVDDDELSAQAAGFARTIGDVRAVTIDGDYQPAAWAKALAAEEADAIVAAGSDRGNELLAHVAARLEQPFAANVTALDDDVVTRIRWGGSLLEEARLHGSPRLVTVAPHTQAAAAPSAAHASSPARAGVRTPTRWARPARRSPPTSTSPAGSAARRSTSPVRRARSGFSRSTPTPRRRSSLPPTTP